MACYLQVYKSVMYQTNENRKRPPKKENIIWKKPPVVHINWGRRISFKMSRWPDKCQSAKPNKTSNWMLKYVLHCHWQWFKAKITVSNFLTRKKGKERKKAFYRLKRQCQNHRDSLNNSQKVSFHDLTMIWKATYNSPMAVWFQD